MTLTPKDLYFRNIVREAAEIWPQAHPEFALGPGHPAEIAEMYERLEDVAEVTAAAMARDEAEYYGVLLEVAEERQRQDTKWGVQNHPSVMRNLRSGVAAANYYGTPYTDDARGYCQNAASGGWVTWAHILVEEVSEAIEAAVDDPGNLRTELIQIAAVAVQWVEALDRASGHVSEAA